ncbi:hypothetical protein DXG03_007698, partial [Asterophora parasitica]
SMQHIHLVFHVIKLLPAVSDPIANWQRVPPPPPEIVNDEPYYKVEKVINSCMFLGKLQYHILWKNYGYKDASWEL